MATRRQPALARGQAADRRYAAKPVRGDTLPRGPAPTRKRALAVQPAKPTAVTKTSKGLPVSSLPAAGAADLAAGGGVQAGLVAEVVVLERQE